MPMYARGSMAWGLCMRCGFRFLLSALVFDGYYPNLRVCSGCYDAQQPQEKLAVVSDPEALYRPSPDAYAVNPPFLTAAIVAGQVVLNWTSIGERASDIQGGGGTGELSAGYYVNRSTDGGVTWTQLASLPNTADEFGALAVETLTFTDTAPPAGPLLYQVRGYDVLENAQYG